MKNIYGYCAGFKSQRLHLHVRLLAGYIASQCTGGKHWRETLTGNVFKMAANRRPTESVGGRTDSLENLVRQVVNHPSFQDAVNSANQRVDETSSTSSSAPRINDSCEPSVSQVTQSQVNSVEAVSSPNQNARRTPREEFQALFHRGASFQQSPKLPQFQRRTSWGPSPSSRSGNRGKMKPYTSNSKGKKVEVVKKTTFAREVVLLRRPSDSMVRGGAKAELQRLGHVLSSFEFDKLWSAKEVVDKLEEAFKTPLENADDILDNKLKFKIMMGMGNELVEPQLTAEQTLTGEMINRIFTQRTIWLLPCMPLVSNDDQEEVEVIEDYEPLPVYQHDCKLGANQDEELVSESCSQLSDIRKYIEGTCTSTLKIQHQTDSLEISMPVNAPPNQHHGESAPMPSVLESKINSLKEMFPVVNTERITQALHENNGDVQKVVNNLLGVDIDEDLDSSNEEILEHCVWDTPLAASKILLTSNDAQISLQKFVEQGVQKFHVGMDVQVKRDSDILTQMIRKYKNPAFNIRKPLNVEFVDEFGVDSGGPTRELFCLLMKRLTKGQTNGINLFEGLQGHLLPCHDYDLLSGGLFVLTGKMILHSVLNGCCGISGLSPAAIAYICTGRRDAAVQHLSLEDFPDPVLQKNVEELLHCGKAKLAEFTLPESPLCIIEELQAAGYPHLEVTEQKRHFAYECCLVHEVITKRLPALDDIRKGLGEVNVMGVTLLCLLERFPELQGRVFPAKSKDVSVSALKMHLQYNETTEEKCVQAKLWFGQYIDELGERDEDSDQETLSDLVQFWTSYPALPSAAAQKLSVDYLEDSNTKLLPEAKTCPMVLSIPVVHSNYQSFKKYLDKGISFAKEGFGKM